MSGTVTGAEYRVEGLPDRLAGKIAVDPDTGCWMWLGGRSRGGYGRVRWEGRKAVAHRVIFHLLRDPGLEVFPGRSGSSRSVLDHVVCGDPGCVNPAHLDETTNRGNLLRVNTTGRFVGVVWHKNRDKWQAQILHDGCHHYIGIYDSEVDAARAYDAAVLELYGAAAETNASLGRFDHREAS